MLIYDDIYSWEGWGGKLRLGSGKCRLRIYDLDKAGSKGLAHLKSIVVVVSDVPESKMPMRSCTSHIATIVTKEFDIDPLRMLWVEYYPEKRYGQGDVYVLPEKYEAVEFTWHEGNAIDPDWRGLKPPMLDIVKKLMQK